ncbi:MAG: hypothetical protein AAF108_09025 [Planctomycetota bacterium]
MGGIMTVGIGGVVTLFVQPFFIGLLVMLSASGEFILATRFWKQGTPPTGTRGPGTRDQ